jgi:hypothetical protein
VIAGHPPGRFCSLTLTARLFFVLRIGLASIFRACDVAA